MSPRWVLDTQVWLDWLHFDDPRCVVLAERHAAGAVELIADPDARDEWQRVLGYPTFALDTAARAGLLAAFDRKAVLQARAAPMTGLPRCRDPDDQKFIDLAVRCAASLILSRDRSLLMLDRRLRREHGIAVLEPQALKAWLAEPAAARGPR